MTRKDYTLIAGSLAADFSIACPVGKVALWCATLSLADKLQRDNPRFDRARFYAAVFGDSDHFAVRDRI